MEYVEEWDPGLEVSLEIRKTYWALRNFLGQAIDEFFDGAITMVDAETLHYINTNSDKEIRVSDICHKFHVQKGTCSENIHKLEEKGLIKLTYKPGDKRIKHVKLTEKGKEVADQVVEIVNKCHESVKDTLSSDEHLSLLTVLTKIRNEVIK